MSERQDPAPEIEVPARLNEDMASVYVDSARVHLSPGTVTIDWSASRPWSSDGAEEVVARLRMSPQTLVIVANLVGQMVEAYESNFGPISPKPDVTFPQLASGNDESPGDDNP